MAPPGASSRDNTTKRETQGPRRPARHRTGPGARQRTRLARQPRVEFPREISTGRLQNLIRPTELAVFPLQFSNPPLIIRRGARPRPAVNFRLLRPGPKRLGMNTQLTCDPGQLAVTLTLPLPDLEQHLHRALAQLIRVLPLCRHDRASSQVSWPPRFPGWPKFLVLIALDPGKTAARKAGDEYQGVIGDRLMDFRLPVFTWPQV